MSAHGTPVGAKITPAILFGTRLDGHEYEPDVVRIVVRPTLVEDSKRFYANCAVFHNGRMIIGSGMGRSPERAERKARKELRKRIDHRDRMAERMAKSAEKEIPLAEL